MKKIETIKYMMMFFLGVFTLSMGSGIVYFLLESGELFKGLKLLSTFLITSGLTLFGFLFTLFVYFDKKKDLLEERQRLQEEKYNNDLIHYRKERDAIKFSMEAKFADLRLLVSQERQNNFVSAYKLNALYKDMRSVIERKPECQEDVERILEETRKIMANLSFAFEGLDKENALTDRIIDKMLDILSGKENVYPERPKERKI